jgi:hypothetical protein
MVPLISKFDLLVSNFDPGINYEGQSLSASKSIQLSGRLYATFTPSLELIQSKLLQK